MDEARILPTHGWISYVPVRTCFQGILRKRQHVLQFLLLPLSPTFFARFLKGKWRNSILKINVAPNRAMAKFSFWSWWDKAVLEKTSCRCPSLQHRSMGIAWATFVGSCLCILLSKWGQILFASSDNPMSIWKITRCLGSCQERSLTLTNPHSKKAMDKMRQD